MANHASAKKRIRQSAANRLRNRYQAKTTRNLIKVLRKTTARKEAEELLKDISSKLDKMAKKNIIHKNSAANQKSKLTRLVSNLK